MHQSIRSHKGQGLAEGAAGLVIFTAVFVGCLMLYINVVVISDYQRKLEVAAQQAAQVMNSDQYFLGMQRKDFDQAKATQHARDVANQVLNTLGLPPASQFSVKTSGQNLNVVTVGVDKLRTVGGLFAPFIPLSATGVVYNSESRGYGYVQLGVSTQKGIGEIFVYVPCYGVYPDPSGKFAAGGMNGNWAGVAIEAQGLGADDAGAWYYAGGQTISPWAR